MIDRFLAIYQFGGDRRIAKRKMKDIEYWKRKGFVFEARFHGEYDLWLNRETMQKLRRYVDGREFLSDLATGEYALVTDTQNAGIEFPERSGGKLQ